MNIVKVIPFSRGAHTEHLTYFSSKEIPVGSIVTIELRKKMIEGLVIESEKASHIKGSIKEAAYKLKKVQKVRAAEFFSKEFLQMVDEASVYFLARKGQVIDALTPTAFIESHEKLSRPKARVAAKSGNLKPEKLALQ